LRRAIQRLIEDPLSEQILAGQWESGDVIEVYLDETSGKPAFRKGDGPVPVPAAATADSGSAAPSMPQRSTRRRGSGAASGGAAGE
jgi:ATP-dependent Clp protease ATP-binding subunit ClpC